MAWRPAKKKWSRPLCPSTRILSMPAAVYSACRQKLDANSVPDFIQVVKKIPKTASEKPQERFLVEALDL